MVVHETAYRAMILLPDPAQTSQDLGVIFNSRQIDGKPTSHFYSGTLLKDETRYGALPTAAYDVATVDNCTADVGTNYEAPTVTNSMCTVVPKQTAGTDSVPSQISASLGFASATCTGQLNGICAGSAVFAIKSPTIITMNISDATLNKLAPLAAAACTRTGSDYPYQTAEVRVYADGLDVTTLATGLVVGGSGST
eukprot:7379265-Prymnesium_polylepis.2